MPKITELTRLEELKAKAKDGKVSDEERRELMSLMDEELEAFMVAAENRSGGRLGGEEGGGWTEENWEEEMQKHPMFVTQEAMNRGEVSPEIQGLADLKYSETDNTPLELAENYREDGNFNFKCKKYRFATYSYSEGLKHALKEVDDVEGANAIKAKLLGNRSAAQFFLKNYRSALIDCRLTLKVQPDHAKAVNRAIQCCLELRRFKEAVHWCDHGLVHGGAGGEKAAAELKAIRFKAEKAMKEKERNERKEALAKKKKERENKQLLDLIKARGIKVHTHKVDEDDDDLRDTWDLDDLEPTHPAALNKRVHLDDDNYLVWPVLFLYPEFGETDFIQEFVENQTFADHLEVMFGDPAGRPGWDSEAKYTPARISLYFEDKYTRPGQPKMIGVDKNMTLTQALSDSRYRVVGGTPAFILMVKGSKFETDYLKKYY